MADFKSNFAESGTLDTTTTLGDGARVITTLLDVSIDADDTELTVLEGRPASKTGMLTIGAERIWYGDFDKSDPTRFWYLLRGQDGTTPASHAKGATVTIAGQPRVGNPAVPAAIIALQEIALNLGVVASPPTTPGDVLTVTGAGTTDWAAPSGGSGSQTPWTSDIDADGFDLTGAGTVSSGLFTWPGASFNLIDAGGPTVTKTADNSGVLRVVGDGNLRLRGALSFGIGADLLSTDTDTGFDKDVAGFPKPTGGSAGGTTVGLTLPLSAGNPANPGSSAEAHLYVKGTKLVIQWNDASTTRYVTFDLTQAATALWATSTSAP